jgi:phage terminase large subunit-like protein
MLAFRTKLLNIFAVNASRTWITGDEIRALYAPFDFDRCNPDNPQIAMVAFDLSVWDDFSAVAYQMYNQQTGTFHFHVDYYLPEGSLDRHPRAELYRVWESKGFLKLLPGDVIDYEAIVQDILSRNGKVIIAGIGYDPYHSKTAVNMLASAGAQNVLKPVRQTYGNFTGSVEALEMLIKQKACTFTPNEITAWCFGNCCIDEDKIGNRKPIKQTQTAKIDGAICCLMSQQLFMDFKR